MLAVCIHCGTQMQEAQAPGSNKRRYVCPKCGSLTPHFVPDLSHTAASAPSDRSRRHTSFQGSANAQGNRRQRTGVHPGLFIALLILLAMAGVIIFYLWTQLFQFPAPDSQHAVISTDVSAAAAVTGEPAGTPDLPIHAPSTEIATQTPIPTQFITATPRPTQKPTALPYWSANLSVNPIKDFNKVRWSPYLNANRYYIQRRTTYESFADVGYLVLYGREYDVYGYVNRRDDYMSYIESNASCAFDDSSIYGEKIYYYRVLAVLPDGQTVYSNEIKVQSAPQNTR